MDPAQVIAESRPMIEEFLRDLGLLSEAQPLDLSAVLTPFSEWADRQDVAEEDRFYLASRLAAFMCEYLIDHHRGERSIVDGRILIRLPVVNGVRREFDPYAVAVGMATNRNSLEVFLREVTS